MGSKLDFTSGRLMDHKRCSEVLAPTAKLHEFSKIGPEDYILSYEPKPIDLYIYSSYSNLPYYVYSMPSFSWQRMY